MILENVTLDVQAGRVTGFLGANGAGKTTLIHLIVGIRRPLAGQVLIFGSPTADKRSRARIGYLPERPYFYEHLTGERTLRYFGELSAMPKPELKPRIAEVLEIVGLSHAARRELRHYSKGMLQRIGIAQAILHRPDLLVLDEPMSGLDPLGRREIRLLIERLHAQGVTIFFSSHVVSDVEAVCDDVVAIEGGRIIGAGPIAEMSKQFGTLEGVFEQ